MTPIIESKLPNVGTTIFTVMSALAQECQAVNLGQGFPDFACDPQLVDAVTAAMQKGLNQYPSMLGVLELRQAVSDKIERLYGRRYDPVQEITIAGNLKQMLKDIEVVGNDLVFRGRIASPTIKISEMMVAGN